VFWHGYTRILHLYACMLGFHEVSIFQGSWRVQGLVIFTTGLKKNGIFGRWPLSLQIEYSEKYPPSESRGVWTLRAWWHMGNVRHSWNQHQTLTDCLCCYIYCSHLGPKMLELPVQSLIGSPCTLSILVWWSPEFDGIPATKQPSANGDLQSATKSQQTNEQCVSHIVSSNWKAKCQHHSKAS